jgi:hypothetical protein
MVPVEVVVILLWLIFGLVGFVRRFPVELGATIGLTAMLFMIDVLGARLGTIATRVLDLFGASIDPSLVRWLMSSAVIGAWVIFMYGGQTLSFPGVWPPNKLVGAILDTMIGLFNGWIVIGTWWYVTDALGYPIQQWGWYIPPLSARAEHLLGLTPQAIIPADYATVIVGGFLVLLIALRVFR